MSRELTGQLGWPLFTNCVVSGGLASCPQSPAWVTALEGKSSLQPSWAFYECMWK